MQMSRIGQSIQICFDIINKWGYKFPDLFDEEMKSEFINFLMNGLREIEDYERLGKVRKKYNKYIKK